MSARPFQALIAFALLVAAPAFAVDDSNRDYAFNPPYGYNAFNIDIPPGYDNASDAVVQPDDGIVLAGSTYRTAAGDYAAVVMRLTASGTIDNSFGTFGRLIFRVHGTSTRINTAVLQGDGKIVVGGVWGGGGFVARLNSDGTMDGAFGINGINAFDADYEIIDVAVYGVRILALHASSPAMKIMALLPDGQLDTTFVGMGASAGYTVINFPSVGQPVAMSIQQDGKMVVAATHASAEFIHSFAVVRVQRDGDIDTSFGNAGQQIISFDWCSAQAGFDIAEARTIAVEPTGRIVAGGIGYGTIGCAPTTLLAALDPDGQPDTTFSGDGQQAERFFSPSAQPEILRSLVVEPEGFILLLANYSLPPPAPAQAEVGLVRLLPSGERDRNFSGDGTGQYGLGLDNPVFGNALAMQGDRPIVAGSFHNDAGDEDFLAFRIVSDRIFADGLQPRE